MSNLQRPFDQSIPDLKTLREAIPTQCFQPSLRKSLRYVFQDLVLASSLLYLGLKLVLAQNSMGKMTEMTLWMLYGIFQGLVFTGIFVMAHEAGHNAFSLHHKTNAAIGFLLHSIILVPFFSWKYSHSRHHRFANHMDKDSVFVPARKSEYRLSLSTGSFLGHGEDIPIVAFTRFMAHQLLGWPLYMTLNAGAGMKSLAQFDRTLSRRQSHMDPGADIFTHRERPYVFLSNIGLILVFCLLYCAAQYIGWYYVFLLYIVPYVWMNHWLVAITFMHHTHPAVPRYEEGVWTFQKGAMSTIDRDFGFIGRHILHGIIEYHVVHHMFPRIPFYYAKEATEAIKPLLGTAYVEQRSSFLSDLWTTFTSCDFVVEHGKYPGYVYWQKAGHEAEHQPLICRKI